MRVQKPILTKQLQNDFSTKKIHRRINTQVDQHTSSKFYKPQIKKTLKTSSKPKFLDVYSKYSNGNMYNNYLNSNNNININVNNNINTNYNNNNNQNNNKQATSTQRNNPITTNTNTNTNTKTNFKLIPQKQQHTYGVKQQLRTEPDEIFRKQQKSSQREYSKKRVIGGGYGNGNNNNVNVNVNLNANNNNNNNNNVMSNYRMNTQASNNTNNNYQPSNHHRVHTQNGSITNNNNNKNIEYIANNTTNTNNAVINKHTGIIGSSKHNIIGSVSNNNNTSSNTKHQQQSLTTNTTTLTGQARYQFHGLAGKGTFGVVYTAKDKLTNEKIAIKKVFQDKKYKNRQHIILQTLKHPNVLQMRDSFLTYENDQEYLNIIMDYFPDNLYQVIKKKELTPINMKLYAYQLFRALNYLSMLSISHRDMKPQNVLVDLTKNKTIICDFGSAKKLVKNQANLAYICSRCYRAPQLIFGATNYTTQIDMWSMGCILVEMINGYPPFLADSQIDQLIQIIKVLGTPSQQDINEMNPKYDMKEYSKFPKIKSSQWKNVLLYNITQIQLLKTKDVLLIDLVKRMLEYSPQRRITAAEALVHEYFDQLRDQIKHGEMRQKLKIVPELFNFTQDELIFISQSLKSTNIKHSQTALKSLIPKWIKSSSNTNSKFGIGSSMNIKNQSSTMSNMVTKPSSSSGQGSRIGTMYVGKKIGGGVNSNVNNKGNVSSNSGVVNNINSSNIKGSNTNIGLK